MREVEEGGRREGEEKEEGGGRTEWRVDRLKYVNTKIEHRY